LDVKCDIADGAIGIKDLQQAELRHSSLGLSTFVLKLQLNFGVALRIGGKDDRARGKDDAAL